MTLPLVIEIAIGLVFIYLILSMLTCEIQEIITILLQWRATHLKRSIENLLAGKNASSYSLEFTNQLYENPLIQSLNQEARGVLASLFRQLIYLLINLYYFLTKTRHLFGSHQSAPSYIAPQTFSSALFQQLNIPELSRRLSEVTARKFSEDGLTRIYTVLEQAMATDPLWADDQSMLKVDYRNLKARVEQTLRDFVGEQVSLSEGLDRVAAQLLLFLKNIETLVDNNHPQSSLIRGQLAYLEQAIAQQKMEPMFSEVLRLIFEAHPEPLGDQPATWMQQVFQSLQKTYPEAIAPFLIVPQQLKYNLLSLAKQSRLKAKNLTEEIALFEQAIADWFDQSMERSSGVYKRNAKGIAILIGFFIAIFINADTFYMINRLSKDTVLRTTITKGAEQVIERGEEQTAPKPAPSPAKPAKPAQTSTTSPALPQASSQASAAKNAAPTTPKPDQPEPPDPNKLSPSNPAIEKELTALKNSVNNVLQEELPLPIGWNPRNIQEQNGEDRGWLFPNLKRTLGWLITGIALSMGAGFWYDILNKVIRVRGMGNKGKESGE
jgi:hypothetical protein